MNFSTFDRTVRKAMRSHRIGTPVALRLVLATTPDPDELESQFVAGLHAASSWLGADIAKIHVDGSSMGGEIAALVRFKAGQSAIVSCAIQGMGEPMVEVAIFGTHGTIALEGAEGFRFEKGQSQLLKSMNSENADSNTIRKEQFDSQDPFIQPGLLVDGKPLSVSERSQIRVKSEAPYGVLLVAGHHTHQPGYAEAFASDSRCRLVGVTDGADVSEERRKHNESLADQLGLPYLDDYSAALERSDVHIVSNCAEPYRRGPLTVQAAKAGKHIYLDKPLCGSLQDASAVVSAVREAGVVAHMFSQIHWSAAQKVRRAVDSGQLGELVSIHTDLCFAKGHVAKRESLTPRTEDATPTRFELPESKRELTNIGVYNLVQLLWLLDRDVQSVVATTGNYFFDEHRRHDMEDFGQILIEFDGGILGSVTAGRTGWYSHPSNGLNRTYILGTRGGMMIEQGRPHIAIWGAPNPWKAPERNPDDPMGMWALPPDSPYAATPKTEWWVDSEDSWSDDTRYFLDCVERGVSSASSAEIAAAATEILFAAYRSSRGAVRVAFEREIKQDG